MRTEPVVPAHEQMAEIDGERYSHIEGGVGNTAVIIRDGLDRHGERDITCAPAYGKMPPPGTKEVAFGFTPNSDGLPLVLRC